MDVKALFNRLSAFHWSPEHPSTYTIQLHGRRAGVGLIAHNDFAAFNYAWGMTKTCIQTETGQHQMIRNWTIGSTITATPVGDTDLAWHLTSMKQPEFCNWLLQNQSSLPIKVRMVVNQLLPNELQSL